MKYKNIILSLFVLTMLGACSAGNYKIKSERGDIVDTVPKW